MLSYTVISYLLYVILSLRLTVWVGRTLFVNGRVFLVDSFMGNEKLADSVNSLLLVGFYLINVGYVSLALRLAEKPVSLETAIESLSSKMGMVLLVLGGMHLFNVYVFSRMRRRAVLADEPPPVRPSEHVRRS